MSGWKLIFALWSTTAYETKIKDHLSKIKDWTTSTMPSCLSSFEECYFHSNNQVEEWVSSFRRSLLGPVRESEEWRDTFFVLTTLVWMIVEMRMHWNKHCSIQEWMMPREKMAMILHSSFERSKIERGSSLWQWEVSDNDDDKWCVRWMWSLFLFVSLVMLFSVLGSTSLYFVVVFFMNLIW